MARFKALTVAAVLLLMLVVIGQNTEAVETRVLLWQFSLPRALWLMITLALGFAMGVLWSWRLTSRPDSDND